MSSNLITKTKYMDGRQCLKLIWTVFNEPEKIPAVDTTTQFRFDQGHLATELAKKRFPGGIDIPTTNFMGNIRQTKELLQKRAPLFEAGFLADADNIYSRIDILKPAEDGQWDIIEVKSSTSVKDEYIDDVAFQKYCLERNGLKIRRCSLMHINNEYVKNGELDPEHLFTVADITDKVIEASAEITEKISEIAAAIRGERPDISIGDQCKHPHDCPLYDLCHAFLPEHNVFHLYRGGRTTSALFEQGILELKDIPDNCELTDKQQIQRECARTGKCHISKRGIKDFVDRLQYPVHYLDFETFHPAIPIVDGTRPYQQVPFQFSLHIVRQQDAAPEHYSFLAENPLDPRPEFLSHLKKHIRPEGSIVAYNKSFEEKALESLAQAFPEHAEWIEGLLPRMIDLLEPFRNFHYYHPDQYGKASLKDVLPALTGKGYDELEIQDGDIASIAYLSATYGDTTAEEKAKIREDLLNYCGRDTEGMVWIVEKLRFI